MTALLIGCGGTSNLGGDSGADPAVDHADLSDGMDRVPDPVDDRLDIRPDDAADGTDVADPCLPQDAVADGFCDAELPGIVWNGSHCMHLGSGCECIGSDCDALYDTIAECVEDRRVCYDQGCEAQPVAEDMCVDCDSDGFTFLGFFWSGRKCFAQIGCMCYGDGCESFFSSMEECQALQSVCDAALCRNTGGMWFPSQAGFCHFYCGVPTDDDCIADSCDCGPGRTFVSSAGCRDEPACTPDYACRATRGVWHPQSECYCGFTCGVPNDCRACLDSCDCGPHRNFDPAAGCVVDAICEQAPAEIICRATGGNWQPVLSCGDYICGVPNMLEPCVMPGCDCGFSANFDPVLGCRYDESCYFRETVQECTGWAGDSSCRPGLVCCDHCAVPSCMWCENPCCETDAACMEDGCYVPPP